MTKIKLMNIKAEKRLYLVEVRSESGQTKECWFHRDEIDFIDPDFFNRNHWGPRINDPTPVAPVVSIAPTPNAIPSNDTPLITPPRNISPSKTPPPPPIIPPQNAPLLSNVLFCDHCGKGFKRRDHLKDHILKQHCGEKASLECPECLNVFGYKSNLSVHLRRTHNMKRDRALELSTKVQREQGRKKSAKETAKK